MGSSKDASDSGRDRVTIYQVAERAGVSIGTVSHALNRPERVSTQTRERIVSAAEELGFVPRGRGRASALRRILVTGPFGRHASYLTRLTGVLQAAGPVEVVVADDDSGDDPVIEQLPLRPGCDGVVIMGAEPTESLAGELADAAVPVVVLDRPSQHCTSVTVDDLAGGRMVADHLCDAGARTFTWVSPAPPPSHRVTNGELRLRGFTGRLVERGHTAPVPWLICDDSVAGGRAAAVAVAQTRPDAVFVVHDLIAVGLVTGLAELGVRVPDEVMVMGYDDAPIADPFGLSTIAQPFAQSGAVALDALRALRAEPNRPITNTALMPTLVARTTTRRQH